MKSWRPQPRCTCSGWDAIKEVTEGLDAPKLGKEDSLESRCTSQLKIVHMVLSAPNSIMQDFRVATGPRKRMDKHSDV